MQTNPVLGLLQSLLVNELETSVIRKVTAPVVEGDRIKLDKTSLKSWDWPAGNIVDYLQPPSSSPLQRLFDVTDIKQNAHSWEMAAQQQIGLSHPPVPLIPCANAFLSQLL